MPAKTSSIIDKTGKALDLLTNTPYVIQNEGNDMYLVSISGANMLDTYVQDDPRFLHKFYELTNNWYLMTYSSGNHVVKLSKSDETGYYHLYEHRCCE